MNAASIKQTMGPPPEIQPPSSVQLAKAPAESQMSDKYQRLKRRYWELEQASPAHLQYSPEADSLPQKEQDTDSQLRRSAELNAGLREERDKLMYRIVELEGLASEPSQPHQAPSSAWPRSLVDSNRARAAFFANLRSVANEEEDMGMDPLFGSNHAGPRVDSRRRHSYEEQTSARRHKSRSSRTFDAHDFTGGRGQGAPDGGMSAMYDQESPHYPIYTRHNQTLASTPNSPARPSYEHHQAFSPYIRAPQPVANGNFRPYSPHRPYPNSGSNSGSVNGSPPPARSSYHNTALEADVTSHGDAPRQSKPKRLKAHTVTTKNFSVPTVPRGPDNEVVLPLNVGIMTVISLGQVVNRQHFHTERYIYPAGYEVTRRYSSAVNPNAEVVYNCKILDGGDGPKFQIIAADTPQHPVVAGTATGAWSAIVKQANQIRNRQHSNSVSGPDFFGLGQNTIKHLIQQLPGANTLSDYVWQNFVEGGPLGGRHAAVIPAALPEDYDNQASSTALPLPERRLSESMEVEDQRSQPPGPPQTIVLPPGEQGLHITEYRPMAQSAFYQPPPTANDRLAQVPRLPSPPVGPPRRFHTPYSQQATATVPQTFAGLMNAYPLSPPPVSTEGL